MIKSVHDYQIDDVFKKDAGFCYVVNAKMDLSHFG